MKLSVILPVFNEALSLAGVFEELRLQAAPLAEAREFILVNDGSTDNSLEVMLAQKTSLVTGESLKVVNLSRNFGHQAAVAAGLAQASGDAAVLMDSDGQDDPAALPRFVDLWRQGHDVVYAVRTRREEPLWMRGLFRGYYRLLSSISRVSIPEDAGNFGLVSRRVLEELANLPEHQRYYPGLRAWVGFRQAGVDVPRRARAGGRAKVGLMGLFRLAFDGIFSFSDAPLRLAFIAAFLLGIVAIAGIFLIISIKLFWPEGTAVPMWASIMCSVIFIGAVQFFLIGLLGEYVGRIYSEVKRRPHYIVREIL